MTAGDLPPYAGDLPVSAGLCPVPIPEDATPHLVNASGKMNATFPN